MTTVAASPGLARELACFVGAEFVTEDPARLSEFAIDEVTPRAVLSPGSPEQIAVILEYAHANSLVVVPAGGFTHQHTGSVPEKIDILVRTERLKDVEHYDPGDMMIGIGAGTTLAEIEHRIAPHRQILPLAAPEPENCTVGGALATAAHGPLKHGYGGIRDYCTGIRFVTSDGKLAKAGAKVVKNVAGYDLMKLLIGSYGTLGIITGASFKLFPQPKQTRTFVADFAQLDDALAWRDRVLQSPLSPLCLELVSPHAQMLIGETTNAWGILLRAAGSDTVLARYRSELGAAVSSEINDDTALWRAITEFPHRLSRHSLNAMLLRIDVALQDVGPVLQAAERAALDNNFLFSAVGRVGVGSMLVGFAPVAVDPPSAMQYVNAVSFLRGAVPRDGSAFVLRCPVEAKRHFSIWGSTPNDLPAMNAIKQAFDPKNILNRGRFLL